MLQRRKVSPNFRLLLEIERRNDTTSATWQALQHAAPIIDDQTVAVSLATARMKSRLSGSHHVAEILDGSRAHERLPVRAARWARERRGYCQNLRACCREAPEQLWKSDIVANRQSETSDRRVNNHCLR